MEIDSLLLTPEDVNKVYQEFNEQQIKHPYILEKQKGHQILFFIGADHSHDTNHPQNKTIKKIWDQFLNKTQQKDCIVLVEGGIRVITDSKQKAIEQHGEAGLITYLAKQADIPVISPEPSDQEEVDEVVKVHGSQQAMYYYIIRVADQWHRLPKKPSLEEYLGYFIKQYQQYIDLPEFNVDSLAKLHNEKYNHPFTPEDAECFNHDSNPRNNPVAATSSNYRDIHIVKKIKALWDQGKSIFIVYGSGHLIKQKPALDKLLS